MPLKVIADGQTHTHTHTHTPDSSVVIALVVRVFMRSWVRVTLGGQNFQI